MENIATLALATLLLITTTALLYLLRNLQAARLDQVTAAERLSSRESETDSLRETLQKLEQDNSTLKQEVQDYREQLAATNTSLELERRQFEEKLALLNESRDQLSIAFKNVANEIFEDKTRKFTATSKESLAAVLNPLQEKIKSFEKRVEETYDRESKERFSLAKEIQNLQEMNARISEDAVNLANALKGDNKAQGNWGEFVLESVLEQSGLVKGREYEVQASLKAEDGARLQPDVVVHMPESRDIIIDSKVSLKAWDSYCSSEEEEARAEFLKQHVQSIRAHVKGLGGKDYQNLVGVNTLDFVLLFMPIEAAYSLAMQHDSELHSFASERNIFFVSPTTLLVVLKTIHSLWRLVQQNQNATEIARQAGNLYDKFVAFAQDLEEVGQRIDATRNSYDKAHNKLISGRGNLVKRTETLKQLGAKTSKQHKGGVLGAALEEDELSPPAGEEASSLDDKTRH